MELLGCIFAAPENIRQCNSASDFFERSCYEASNTIRRSVAQGAFVCGSGRDCRGGGGVLTACSSERVTEPEIVSPMERSGTHGTIGGFASVQPESVSRRFGTPLLDLSAGNAGLCVEAAVGRDALGRFTGFTGAAVSRADSRVGSSDRNYKGDIASLEQVIVFTFDARGKQISRKDCVLERGARLQQFLAQFGKKSASSTGTLGQFFNVASISSGTDCYYAGWAGAVNCDGEVCYPYMMLRSSSKDPNGVVTEEAERVGGTGARSYGDIWYCEGGGTLFDNGNGTVTYHAPGGGSSGGGDPGTGGDSGGGSGGGTNCDSRYEFNCYQPLTGSDSTLIASSISFLKPYAHIADPSARDWCEQMFNRFIQAFEEQRIFRGRTDGGLHLAETVEDTITHVDPAVFVAASYPQPGSNSARRILLGVLLHEAAHMIIPGSNEHEGDKERPHKNAPYSYVEWDANGRSVCVN